MSILLHLLPDLVIIHYVLHDIPREERIQKLNRMKVLLKESGRIIISEPTTPSHGISSEETSKLMMEAGFTPLSLNTRKKKFFAVYQKPRQP
jgi:hypothetical protein